MLAKQNKHAPAKILIKDLVRTRKQIDNLYNMHSQLKAMAMQMSTITSNIAISDSLKKASTTM